MSLALYGYPLRATVRDLLFYSISYFNALWQNHQSKPSYSLSRFSAAFTFEGGGTIAWSLIRLFSGQLAGSATSSLSEICKAFTARRISFMFLPISCG